MGPNPDRHPLLTGSEGTFFTCPCSFRVTMHLHRRHQVFPVLLAPNTANCNPAPGASWNSPFPGTEVI
ncbi:hypothetical protein XELAEV_18033689mg [Xenopus laevis]|uniref:Uncharacterized protein n=1 Tax=Xenopus laevis TaxID=8355 RepID=A0A974HEN1_XENLA|nr:hypothetical protein XELAEV_18033689mg [Xenopus laevis]